MSTVIMDKFPARKIKEKLNLLDKRTLTKKQNEIVEGFNHYPKVDFNNADEIARLLKVSTNDLLATREVSADKLNYRNKLNDNSLEKVNKIIKLMNKVDNQYVICGGDR